MSLSEWYCVTGDDCPCKAAGTSRLRRRLRRIRDRIAGLRTESSRDLFQPNLWKYADCSWNAGKGVKHRSDFMPVADYRAEPSSYSHLWLYWRCCDVVGRPMLGPHIKRVVHQQKAANYNVSNQCCSTLPSAGPLAVRTTVPTGCCPEDDRSIMRSGFFRCTVLPI